MVAHRRGTSPILDKLKEQSRLVKLNWVKVLEEVSYSSKEPINLTQIREERNSWGKAIQNNSLVIA